eukprot:SAG22_NODE_52_length_24288_cov_15.594568_11_plen_132_part_00
MFIWVHMNSPGGVRRMSTIWRNEKPSFHASSHRVRSNSAPSFVYGYVHKMFYSTSMIELDVVCELCHAKACTTNFKMHANLSHPAARSNMRGQGNTASSTPLGAAGRIHCGPETAGASSSRRCHERRPSGC